MAISATHAARALTAYGLAHSQVELLSQVDCVVLRVHGAPATAPAAAHGTILKIYPAHKHDLDGIQAEVDWLLALTAETELRVPIPLAGCNGAFIQNVADGPLEGRRCVLFTWLPGRSLDAELTPRHLRQAGTFIGALHRHSAQWHTRSTPAVSRRAFSHQALSWVLEMRELPPTISPHEFEVLRQTASRLRDDIAAIGERPEVFGFIHTDLFLSNFLFDDGKVGVVDFSDCAWGHYADDIASALVFLKHPFVGNHDHSGAYDAFRDAFLEGYQSARPLPADLEATLATFFAARVFLVWTYIHDALTQVPWIPNAVRQCREYLERYLASAAPAPLPPRT